MSVEAFLSSQAEMLRNKLAAAAEEEIRQLKDSLAEERAVMLGVLQDRVAEASASSRAVKVSKADSASSSTTPASSSSTTTTNAKESSDPPAATKPSTKFQISLAITSGPHSDSTFTLQPHYRRRVPKVGRSTGRLFLQHGISLSEDSEVSTTHAKFEVSKDGRVLFTDVGSTNGSSLNGAEVQQHEGCELHEGDELLVGQSMLRVQEIAAM